MRSTAPRRSLDGGVRDSIHGSEVSLRRGSQLGSELPADGPPTAGNLAVGRPHRGRLAGLQLRHALPVCNSSAGRTKTWEAIPYGLAVVNDSGDTDFEIGGDFRWRPSSTIGVDLTVNPDFALIEADVEVINLTRFELFVPEKRPFFLEGSERYSQRIRQFYSRRIGDITWGGKATGTAGKMEYGAIATSENRVDVRGRRNPTSRLRHRQAPIQPAPRLQRGFPRLQPENRRHRSGFHRFRHDALLHRNARSDRAAPPGQRSHRRRRSRLVSPTGIRQRHDALPHPLHQPRPGHQGRLQRRRLPQGRRPPRVRHQPQSHLLVRKRGDGEDPTGGQLQPFLRPGRSTPELGVRRRDSTSSFAAAGRSSCRSSTSTRSSRRVSATTGSNSKPAGTAATAARSRSSPVPGSTSTAISGSTAPRSSGPSATGCGSSTRSTRLELDPDPELETTWIHVFNGVYYFNPDLFIKLFLQTNTAVDKLNIQAVWVWRFKPPFGSIQVAYQRGTSEIGEASEQGRHAVHQALLGVLEFLVEPPAKFGDRTQTLPTLRNSRPAGLALQWISAFCSAGAPAGEKTTDRDFPRISLFSKRLSS